MADPGIDRANARLEFVTEHMPLLAGIGDRFKRVRPFAGLSIAVRIHVEAKTAVLARVLVAGGATVTALGNQGTTVDDVAAVLRHDGVEVLDSRTDSKERINANLDLLAAREPHLVLDNGAELIERLVSSSSPPRGATEETTSGAFRLRRALEGTVPFPVIVINDSPLKAIVENKHGVGQSVIQVILQITNVLLHHKRLVVFGYGWCGRGIALYARANGARVIVVESDEIKSLEAAIDGFDVARQDAALATGDIFITATGETEVISVDAIRQMRSGAILANAGHFDTEIDVAGLAAAAQGRPRGPSITQYRFDDGHTVDILADGQMVNLAATGSRGNAIEIMDLGFALQALSLERLALDPTSLPTGDQPVPDAINKAVAVAATMEMMRRRRD